MESNISLEEKAVVRALQHDLPLVSEPYKVLAEELGMSEEKLLNHIDSLVQKKALKRISIALRHNNVGYKINKMGVWRVPEAKINSNSSSERA